MDWKVCVGGTGVATLMIRSSLLKAMLLLFSRLVYGCRRIWVFKNGKLQEGSIDFDSGSDKFSTRLCLHDKAHFALEFTTLTDASRSLRKKRLKKGHFLS